METIQLPLLNIEPTVCEMEKRNLDLELTNLKEFLEFEQAYVNNHGDTIRKCKKNWTNCRKSFTYSHRIIPFSVFSLQRKELKGEQVMEEI